MLLTKEVEVKLSSRTVKYYENLGYEIPMKKASKSYKEIYNKEYVYDFSIPIKIKVEDLTKGCNAEIQVLCDYCKDEIITMKYCTYLNTLKHINKSACQKCKGKKEREIFLIKYGVQNPSQLEEFKEKYRHSCIEKYGVDNYFKTEEFNEKRKVSMNEKYGVEYPLQSEKIQKKWIDTCISKYGFSNPAKAQEVKDKAAKTCTKRYGDIAPAKSLEVREKIVKTLYDNSSQKSSRQQRYICKLFSGVLNFPVKYYNADIYLPNDNLIVEIDFGGHTLSVKTGKITQEEFNKKEIVRNNVIKREGYKQMRIISSKDYLPSDKILLQMLEYTKEYFSSYPNRSWIEFNIDSSSIRNAEQKEGVFFNYGTLRKIKKSDIENINTETDCA